MRAPEGCCSHWGSQSPRSSILGAITRFRDEAWQNPDPAWTVADWENAALDFTAQHSESLVYDLPARTYALMSNLLAVQPEANATQLS
ncbi:hypothetical protein GCM10025871_40250 [Deinococcus metallilatus]|nr:hypothetical protein GCM10025871_40250 [Deinococcus metallilatus]